MKEGGMFEGWSKALKVDGRKAGTVDVWRKAGRVEL